MTETLLGVRRLAMLDFLLAVMLELGLSPPWGNQRGNFREAIAKAWRAFNHH